MLYDCDPNVWTMPSVPDLAELPRIRRRQVRRVGVGLIADRCYGDPAQPNTPVRCSTRPTGRGRSAYPREDGSPVMTSPRIAAAQAAIQEIHDRRHVEDPRWRAKAIRLVRLGLQRGLITVADLGLESASAVDGEAAA